MKKVVLVVIGVLLAMVILSGGCAPKTTPPPAPVAPSTQNVTGNLTGINTPADPGPDIITVQTPQGEKTFPITATTTYSLDGQACLIDAIDKVDAETGQLYTCTVVFDPLGNAVAVYVAAP